MNTDANQQDLARVVKVEIVNTEDARTSSQNTFKASFAKVPIDMGVSNPLWSAIRNRTDAIRFQKYREFLEAVGNADLCKPTSTDVPNCGKDGSNESPVCEPCHRNPAMPHISDLVKNELAALRSRPVIFGVDSYQTLKALTELFLMFETGVAISFRSYPTATSPDEPTSFTNEELKRRGTDSTTLTLTSLRQSLNEYLVDGSPNQKLLPYLENIATALMGTTDEGSPFSQGNFLQSRLSCPAMIELLWSYWHEEGMLVQTMNAIALRFQNRRSGPGNPLANLELNSLQPLNNFLWGFIQDENNRLTVARRAYEYDHHYGFRLYGKAVPSMNPADSRTKFIAAFHNVLHRAMIFYQEESDTMVNPDGFLLLNSIKELHLVLAEGAHNQYGDLPWTARGEMLMMQWLLARPEMREFLRGRQAVPNKEAWIGTVDAMKRLQGWTDVSTNHFRDLADYGEKLLLSMRLDDWSGESDQNKAKEWASYFKPEVQSYIHSYMAVTGVDLSGETVSVRSDGNRNAIPSSHLRNRLSGQPRNQLGGRFDRALGSSGVGASFTAFDD
jgi:hypothetical protein